MRVLVACEYSGEVRRAFRARGHDAWSIDLLDAEDGPPGAVPFHIKGDIRDLFETGWGAARTWDMILAFPPCTHLASSGARWWTRPGKAEEQARALAFVRSLLALDCPRIAIENPIGRIGTAIRKPDQIIHPWMFGHPVTKATCLWLKGLPPLTPTRVLPVEERRPSIHMMGETKDRWKKRSRTFSGIAAAMADQWGAL
jgi:hypothetical protein